MRRAVLYARVSSKEQEKEGFSIPAQIHLLREYAERHQFEVSKEYLEAETAKKSGREQFAAMIDYLEKQKHSTVLLVEKTDRLYRNFRDYIAIDDLINRFNHEIHLVKEGEVIGRNASSHTKLIHGIKVVLAKNYIDNLSEECQKGTRQKLEGGGWSFRAPYGYINVKRGSVKTVEVIPEQAEFIKAAFNLYSTSAYSLDRLRSVLFEQGYAYKESTPIVPKQTLECLLKNPFYIGEMEVKGHIYQGNHQPIVDHEVWLLAQRALRKDGKPKTFEAQAFKYSGLLYCGECNCAYVGEYKHGGRYTYYRCCSKKQGCSQGYVSEQKINAQIEALLKSLVVPEDIKQIMIAIVEEQANVMERTANAEENKIDAVIKRLRGQLKEALHEKIKGNIDNEMWLEVSADFQNRIRQEEAKRSKTSFAMLDYSQMVCQLVEIPEMLNRKWFTANEERKRELLTFLVSKFSLKDGNVSYTVKEPFSLFVNQALCLKWCKESDFIRKVADMQPMLERLRNALTA